MRGRIILTNTGFNMVGMAVNTLIALVLTPFLLAQLGSEQFGVWALLGVIITAAQLADFGLGRALIRDIAKYRSEGRFSLISRDFNSLWWPLLFALSLLTLAGWYLAPDLAALLGVPASEMDTALPALRLLVLLVPLLGLGQLFAATLDGAQRMGYTSGALTLNRLIFAIGAFIAVFNGWGVLGVALAYFVAVAVQVFVLAGAARRVTSTLHLNLRLYDRKIFTSDAKFGVNIFAANLIALGYAATNKIILARVVGLTSVAYYELAAVIALQLFALALSMSRALYPALSAAQTHGGLSDVRHLYGRAVRLLVLAILPVAGILIALALPFITAWLGKTTLEPAVGMQWLVAAWTIAAIATAGSVGLLALGRPGLATLFTLYNAVMNLVLVLILVPSWGYWGVVAANVIAVSTSGLLTLIVYSRLIYMDWRASLNVYSPGIWIWSILLAIVLRWVAAQIATPNLLELAVLAGSYLIVYGLGLLILPLLRAEEEEWLTRQLGRRFGLRGGLT